MQPSGPDKGPGNPKIIGWIVFVGVCSYFSQELYRLIGESHHQTKLQESLCHVEGLYIPGARRLIFSFLPFFTSSRPSTG